ncbi:Anhydro-N-acetylmuramic acid kinase [Planctomycetes bacterium FF15]|uniref:Anhydro-N-acetylmuramic acid kinase n=2 Tax=Bremerella alba TaxID=980252 RepID=A0A7V9A638_9BACT|nr:Anhydro-N-acetylmuramic acid kinase [Bremerella alba]
MPSKTLGLSSFVEHARRYFVGTAMTPCSRFVSAAILKVDGRGLNACFDVIHQLNVRTPPDVRAMLEQGGAGLTTGTQLPGMVSRLVSELQVVNVERLLNSCGVSAEKVTAIGQRGPVCGREFWKQTGSAISIGDPAILAEATGITVMDHFEQRDIAKGGSAHGLDVLPMWLLLTQAVDSVSARPKVVVRLDHSIELFYLPARRKNRPIPSIVYRQLGPGFALLHLLQSLCEPQPSASQVHTAELIDLLSRLAIEKVSADSPHQVQAIVDGILEEMPQLLGSSVTLNHAMESYWTESIHQAIAEHFPRSPEFAEIIVLGRGARREKLVQQIADQFPGVPVTTEVQRGWISGAVGASIAAIFASLHVDQVSGNLPDLTGASAARVLGRITPGNPGNWRGVLAQMELAARQTMPLREAI